MSGRMLRALNTLTLFLGVSSGLATAVLSIVPTQDKSLLLGWALGVGVLSLMANASLEQFRPNATNGGVR